MAWVGAAVAAGLTATKMVGDSAMQEKTGKVRASQERSAPFTHVSPDQKVEWADYGKDLVQGVGMGLSAHGMMTDAGLEKAATDRLNTGGSLDGWGKNLLLKDNPTQDSMWGYKPPTYPGYSGWNTP